MQWRQARVIGNRAADTIVDPANPARAIDDPAVNANNYVRTPRDDMNVVANIGYTLTLKERRQVVFNLRVNNLLNRQDVLYFNTTSRPKNGDYSSPARVATPNNFALRDPTS